MRLASIRRSAPHAVLARFDGNEEAVLHDAVWDASFRETLFRLMSNGERLRGKAGELIGSSATPMQGGSREDVLPSQVLSAEQSNSSMLFGNKLFLKLYRKLEDGVNPDVEVTRFLSERGQFTGVPAFGGAIEYRRHRSEPTVVCLLQSAVQNEGDAWALTLGSVGRFYERVLARKADLQNQSAILGGLLDELIGGIYPEKAKLLGQRTGEMHQALASTSDDPAFAPEPFNAMAQRSVIKPCVLRCGERLLCCKKDYRNCRSSFATKQRRSCRRNRRSWRRNSGYSRVHSAPTRSASTVIII